MESRFLKVPVVPLAIAIGWFWVYAQVAAAEPLSSVWQERSVGTNQPASLPPAAVWFRAWLKVPDNLTGPGPAGSDLWRDSMTLTLQDLPGPVVIFLNGQKIIETRDIPMERPRRFKVPKGFFEKGAFNTFVIRIDGASATRGLTTAPVFAGYFDEVKMQRSWQITTMEPSALEMKAITNTPPVAAYLESDFHPSTTVMQASPEPVRGLYVSPADALLNLHPESDLIVEELLHEPEVAQPTHVSFDERGRMWVAQYRQYPYPAGVKMISRDKFYRSKYDRVPPPPPNHTPGADIISVHEDRDGDGKYETHRQVLTGLNLANAVLHGHGGIWVMQTPYLLFYPDADKDDVPDGPPEVRLQGFGLEDTHSVANGLAWGPDGWIYGAQGSTTTSRVTRPGIDATNAPGIYVEGCMVWRYHPERKIYEIFADGSGNTFGVSFDAEGRLFTGHNGGDTRGWHHIQDGLYLKQGKDPGKFGPAPNPFAFGELPMMHSTHPIARFTHMTIMGEGSALPERLRGRFLAVDPLHHYVVASERKRIGSTFETTDIGFPLRTDDLTFRPVYLANAPDGSLVIADFREEYIAHGQNYQSQIDPATGRIYRLRGKGLPLEHDVNLSKKTTAQLVALLSHANQWHRQTAVRLLGERRDASAVPLLQAQLETGGAHPALEALWALYQMGRLDESLAAKTLAHPSAMVRAWTIRLLGDERRLPSLFAAQLTALAAREPDAEVRCQMLSTARRIPAAQSLPLFRAIAIRTDDLADPFIPLMAWFVLESHCANEREAVLAVFDDATFWKAPFVRQHLESRLMRRFAASGSRQELIACAALLAKAPAEADRKLLMVGFEEAFKGRSIPSLPDELVQALARTGRMSLMLRVRQGEPAAITEALQQITNSKTAAPERLAAIRIFGEVKHTAAASALLSAATQDGPRDLRVAACTALQLYDDPDIGETLAAAWPTLPPVVQNAALNLLTSRTVWSLRLLDSFVRGRVPRPAFTTDILTRLRLHQDERLTAMVDKHFPVVPPTARESLRPRIDQVRRIITSQPGDAYKGEAHFNARCATCHTLFFKGGKIGPDLTSYQRDDLGTMLVSIIDPNAEIREGFQNYIITTKDERTLSGFLADQDANVVVLRGFDGADLSLRRAEISTMNPAGTSIMPEAILDGLTDTEIRDLFAYLRQSQPITN
ncbi:MAG: putative rane-bound dehydrogenase domain protein [Verrucomicrobiales bacterium]|nr:putative rane-bound dehydrogenase domain protein [Verrucomicrobiales bacterium]